jgi:hypothetical protein
LSRPTPAGACMTRARHSHADASHPEPSSGRQQHAHFLPTRQGRRPSLPAGRHLRSPAQAPTRTPKHRYHTRPWHDGPPNPAGPAGREFPMPGRGMPAARKQPPTPPAAPSQRKTHQRHGHVPPLMLSDRGTGVTLPAHPRRQALGSPQPPITAITGRAVLHRSLHFADVKRHLPRLHRARDLSLYEGSRLVGRGQSAGYAAHAGH